MSNIKTWEELVEFARPYGYKKTVGGAIRQESWHGLAFNDKGTVKWLYNGAVVARNVSLEGMAILIKLLGKG